MAPKTDPSPAKLALILTYFHTPPLTAYTLPQLEKSLPTNCPGVSSMLVKDLLQHLVGNSALNCEKIGSGNWYWHFPSAEGEGLGMKRDESRREVENVRAGLEGMVAEVEKGVEVLRAEEERLALGKVVEGMQEEEVKLRSGGEGSLREMREERGVWEERVAIVEDNINILLAHLKRLGTDEEAIENCKITCDIVDLE